MARKILLADDSVTAQNMGRKILSDAGYDVATVNNGSAALKRIAEHKPDLIVLDVYMPGYSGLEVCQRLKDSPETEGIPILLTVGKLEPFKPEEARRVRAEAFIVKPFEASELLSVLTRLEDQMVPGGKSAGNGRSEGHGDSETGWKNRLRFPSKKKKEEPAPEPDTDWAVPGSRESWRRKAVPAVEKNTPAAPAIPEIPRDITPEELDALSALAAKLDGEAPVSQNAAPVEKAPPSEAKQEFEVASPQVESKSAEISAAQPEAPSAPAEEAKPASEILAERPQPVVAEEKQPEPVPVNVAALAEKEPAPVDGDDEPLFAVRAAAQPATPEEAEAKQALTEDVAASAAASAVEPVESPAKDEERKADETQAAVKAADAAPPATTAAQLQDEQEGPAPSEEELAEALRLLTPAAESSSTASEKALVAADVVPAGKEEHNASTGQQWMAVAVAVDAEEAARSLEAEMFQTLACPTAASDTAVANTTGAESNSVTPASTTAKEPVAPVDEPASAVAAAPAVASEETPQAKQEAQENVEDATPVEEVAAATFADAVRQEDEVSASADTTPEPVVQNAGAESGSPAAATTMATSDGPDGGTEDMGRERGKSGKSNWHQIRNAAPAVKDAVEAAKQAEAEEGPKAMAAAAASTATAPDPAAIASIVDSVLADLRPKIVEEIAKKLAGK